MGLFHLYRGDLDRAEARLAQAVERGGGAYYEAYNNLGAVLWRKRRYDEAARCYEIVLAHDPANHLARERVAGRPAGPG
jgi:tetratricopeptide (TPR) repeat protein